VFHVSLERVNTATEQADGTWSNSFRAASRGQIHSALHEAARWLRQTAGEPDSSVGEANKRPEEVTTDSWEALREYSHGMREAQANDLPKAITSLDSAIRRDPLFVMAHMQKGDYCVRLNRFAEGYQAWDQAIRALQQRPPSRREELMIRAMHADDMQDFPRAIAAYKELMRQYPHLEYPWRFVSSPLMKVGRVEESLEVVRQRTQRWGDRWQAWRKRLDYLVIAGQMSEAATMMPEMQRRKIPAAATRPPRQP